MKQTRAKRISKLAVPLAFSFCSITTAGQVPPKAKHINQAIDMLEQGQPIYYTGSHSGTEGTFEQGKKDAQTVGRLH
jgi:hypothetical protein